MPNVIVTCVFNPPVISIQGASLRQDTIDALQRTLPKHTTTSVPTQRQGETPKFLLTNGGTQTVEPERITNDTNGEGEASVPSTNAGPGSSAAAPEGSSSPFTCWSINLGQHYCCQKGRSMIFLAIMEALEEEGFVMRGSHTVVTEQEKDVTRLIFARA